jgi:hypothetical protein
MIPPAPEQIYQAIQKQLPVVRVQPDGLITQQINELTKLIKIMVS